MIRDTLNANWLISMLQKPFLADKNKLCLRVLPTYLQASNTIATENHNLLSPPLSGVRRLTGSLSGKSHLLFESKQPFPHPWTRSVLATLSSKMSPVTDAYPEPIEKRSGNEAKGISSPDVLKQNKCQCFQWRGSGSLLFFCAFFSYSNRKLQNMSCYLLSNRIQ